MTGVPPPWGLLLETMFFHLRVEQLPTFVTNKAQRIRQIGLFVSPGGPLRGRVEVDFLPKG